MSAFASYQRKMYPHVYDVEIHLHSIAGGTPSDPKVALGWIKSKFQDNDEFIRDLVLQTMADRGIGEDEAIEHAAILNRLNGFKRDEHGLYIEGRHVKAMLKECASIAQQEKKLKMKWGTYENAKGEEKGGKNAKSFLTEHVFVIENRIHLGRLECDEIIQRFIHKWSGSAIQYEEIVYDADISFTVESDHAYTDDEWAAIWTTGERNGLGASRSQDCGRFTVTKWERQDPAPKKRRAS